MQLKDKIKIIPRKKIADDRGWFLKVIDGYEENLPNYTGETYITFAEPFQNKGGHYHNLAKEWFTLLSGECIVKLYDMVTTESLEIQMSENDNFTLYVPPGVAHIFMNINAVNTFMLLAYTDQLYNPADTIPFFNFL